MQQIIDTVVRQLAKFPPCDHVTNQYAYVQDPTVNQANAIRRHNLSLYLGQMLDRKPAALWVGEAPGYRGCRMTGVPFTSGFILVHGEGSLLEETNALANRSPDLLGLAQGYKPTHDEWGIEKEATATMVWQAVAPLPIYPLLWNAFPLHPFPPDIEHKNRPPTKYEIEVGKPLILKLLKIYNINKLAAIGRSAERCLQELDLDHKYIPHPSYGRKTQFGLGVDEFVANFN